MLPRIWWGTILFVCGGCRPDARYEHGHEEASVRLQPKECAQCKMAWRVLLLGALLMGLSTASARSLPIPLHRSSLAVTAQEAAIELPSSVAAQDCNPSQVHLALSEDADSVRLVWTARSDRCLALVHYVWLANSGRNATSSSPNTTVSDGAWLSSTGDSFVLTERQMCSGKARSKKFRKALYTATLTSLEPGAEYQYRIDGDSRVRSFVATPERGPHSRVSFVAYGDMGYAGGRKTSMAGVTMSAIMQLHEARPLDLALHVGDLAYADGSYAGWDDFMEMIEDLASEVPYMVAIGNHEYAYSGSADHDPSGVVAPYRPYWGNFGDESGGECGSMYAHHFLMPSLSGAVSRRLAAAAQRDADADGGRRRRGVLAEAPAPSAEVALPSDADNAPFWYSFDYGAVHFTVLSSEHDVGFGSPQRAWLQADLATVDRCRTPWVVVSIHRPMYVVFPHKSNRDVGEHLREYLEDLLLEYRVDVVLSGHVHSYYRSCSVRHEVCTDDDSGMVHLVIGTGGHQLSDVDSQQRLWCRAASTDHGFGHFSVHGEQLKFSFIRSTDNQVVDEVKLYAQVSREECEAFMTSRRGVGVPLAAASAPAEPKAVLKERRREHDVHVIADEEIGGGKKQRDDSEHSDDGGADAGNR